MADASDTATPETEVKDLTPQPASRSRGAFLPLVSGGLVAGALGFGAGQIWPLVAPQDSSPTTEIAAIQAQLAEAQAITDTLTERLSALEGAAPPDLGPMQSRIDSLERSVAQLSARPFGADPAALAQIQAEVELLKRDGLPAALMADVQSAFDTKLAEVDTHLAEVKAGAEAIAQASAHRAALLQLRGALDSGAPFQGALEALAGLAIPAALSDHAAAGIASFQDLRDAFPDAARAALEAALQANMGESWAERVSNFLLKQTGARSLTPRDGNDPDAVLSRAEAALAEGGLAPALSEIATLPPVAQAAMADWLGRAQQRLDALQALQSLSDAVGL